MDTTEFLNLMADKNTKEKVLDALEKVQIDLAVLNKKGSINSIDDALRIINDYTAAARLDYEQVCISYFEAAARVFHEANADTEHLGFKRTIRL